MAATRNGGDDEGMITAINVTPLVDIVLVLLIIFMVTAKLIVNPQLPIELPRARTGEPPPPAPLSVVLGKDGSIIADGMRMNEDGLVGLVRARKAAGGELNALISADLGALHGRVVRVMDLLRHEGVSRFGIAVTEEELYRAR
jgi:biopolymer transport protein ExbD